MVGSALCRQLKRQQQVELITASRAELDLTNQAAVIDFFEQQPLDEVYLAAAKVGGIQANSVFPAEFIYQNLQIQNNVIHAAFQSNVGKLLFLGSSCIYPRLAEQPMTEEALLTGALEPTNEPYAIAKIAGIKLCESYNRQYGIDYRSVMPTNLYGEHDNFHPDNSHVIPAMIRRFHEAKSGCHDSVLVWGTGQPRREFLHVEDMASASVHVMNLTKHQYTALVDERCSHINVGSGNETSIRELAEMLSSVVDFRGALEFDASKPDGAPRKLLSVDRLHQSGWRASIGLEDGLKRTYQWFVENESTLRGRHR